MMNCFAFPRFLMESDALFDEPAILGEDMGGALNLCLDGDTMDRNSDSPQVLGCFLVSCDFLFCTRVIRGSKTGKAKLLLGISRGLYNAMNYAIVVLSCETIPEFRGAVYVYCEQESVVLRICPCSGSSVSRSVEADADGELDIFMGLDVAVASRCMRSDVVVAFVRLFVDKLLDDRLVDKDIDHQTELLKDSHVVCSGK